jgi:hypothetical protein
MLRRRKNMAQNEQTLVSYKVEVRETREKLEQLRKDIRDIMWTFPKDFPEDDGEMLGNLQEAHSKVLDAINELKLFVEGGY